MPDQPTQALPEVPRQVFQKFVDELRAGGIPEDVLERLRKVLLDDRNLTEGAIRGALLPDSDEI